MVSSLLVDLFLLLLTHKTLVWEDVTAHQKVNNALSSNALFCISWDKIIVEWNAMECGYGDQLVAKVAHLFAGTVTTISATENMTPLLAFAIADYVNWHCVQQTLTPKHKVHFR